MAPEVLRVERREVYQWDSQTMSEIMTSGAEPYYTVIIAVVIMTIAGLSLWMSPVIAYKVAMGQVYESVSSTVSSWAGALVGAGIEFYSSAMAASISNQAERAQAQAQFVSELTRAGTSYDVERLPGTPVQYVGQCDGQWYY